MCSYLRGKEKKMKKVGKLYNNIFLSVGVVNKPNEPQATDLVLG